MRIFKNKPFSRFAKTENITEAELVAAVERANNGQIDVDLGGGLMKQRIARPGQGKSGGYRTVIIFRSRERAFFVLGYTKNERSNIDISDRKILKKYAKEVLSYSDADLRIAITQGEFVEVRNDRKTNLQKQNQRHGA
jgi:hypothetical protein